MHRQNIRRLVPWLGIAGLLGLGCEASQGDPGGSGGQATGGGAGQPTAGAAGQGSSGTSGQSGAGGRLDDPTHYTGPIVSVDTSTLDPTYQSATCARQLRLARAGQEVAALYSEAGKVWLQRLSLGGQTIGDPTALGDAPTDAQGDVPPPHVSLASDGTSYVACWDTGVTTPSLGKAKVTCVRMPAGGGAVESLFTETACRPSVAWRGEGFVVVTQRPEHVTVRYLDPASTVAPFEVPVPKKEADFYAPSDILLAPTASGFAMVTVSDLALYRLDPELKLLSASQVLDSYSSFVTTPHLLAVGDTVVLGKARPYEFRVTLAAPGQPAVQVSFDGGVKLGMNAALTVDSSSVGVFAPLSTVNGAALIYHAVDPVHPPTTTVYPAVDAGPLGGDSWGGLCSLAAVPVDGATLVAVPALHSVEVTRFALP